MRDIARICVECFEPLAIRWRLDQPLPTLMEKYFTAWNIQRRGTRTIPRRGTRNIPRRGIFLSNTTTRSKSFSSTGNPARVLEGLGRSDPSDALVLVRDAVPDEIVQGSLENGVFDPGCTELAREIPTSSVL